MLSMFMEYFKAVPSLTSVGLISLPDPYVRSHSCLLVYAQDSVHSQIYVPAQEDNVPVQE